MNIKTILNDDDLHAALRHLESISQAEAGTAEAVEKEALVTLIEAYESNRHSIEVTALKGIIKKPSNPVSIEDMNSIRSIWKKEGLADD